MSMTAWPSRWSANIKPFLTADITSQPASMALSVTVASLRNVRMIPAQCCVVEMEDVLLDVLDAHLITPVCNRGATWQSRLAFRYDPGKIYSRGSSDRHCGDLLILSALTMSDVVQMVIQLGRSIRDYDHVWAIVFDAGLSDKRKAKSTWQKKFSTHHAAVDCIDRILTPVTFGIASLSQLYGIPTDHFPLAADVVKYGNNRPKRLIDVTGYGRLKQEHSVLLSQSYNHPESARMYFHTDHMNFTTVTDHYIHRRYFWKVLTNSKISLCYSHKSANPASRFRHDFVGQRWFESLAGGCAIVGYKPDCTEAEKMFGWEDALIELPAETPEIVPFLESLLNDEQRMQVIYERNYYHALVSHDWIYRIENLLSSAQLPLPPKLAERKYRLSKSASAI